MVEDKLTRDQRIALESVTQALVSLAAPMGGLGDAEFNDAMNRAARIERFIRKRDDDAIDGVPVLRDGDTVIVQQSAFTTQDEVDRAQDIWRHQFGNRVQVTFLGWPVVAVHRPSTGKVVAGAVPGYGAGGPRVAEVPVQGSVHIGHVDGAPCTGDCRG